MVPIKRTSSKFTAQWTLSIQTNRAWMVDECATVHDNSHLAGLEAGGGQDLLRNVKEDHLGLHFRGQHRDLRRVLLHSCAETHGTVSGLKPGLHS